eukprot:Gb_17840 [translate_table: standard]
MGFERNQLVESLRSRIQNEGTVAYYLMLDNRCRISNGYLGTEFQEAKEYVIRGIQNDLTTSTGGQRFFGTIEQGGALRSQFPAERKWALGLQSRAHPREIMTEVLKALQELDVGWKKIGHYNMKCRWFPCLSRHVDSSINKSLHGNQILQDDSTSVVQKDGICSRSPPNIIKFEVQLYKTREEKYLLDLQRVQGPHFLFLDLCADFLAQLRVL